MGKDYRADLHCLHSAPSRRDSLDFDDLIGKTVFLLKKFPEIANYYRRKFRHILVDEYQDTNHAQYALVRELVGAHPQGNTREQGRTRMLRRPAN